MNIISIKIISQPTELHLKLPYYLKLAVLDIQLQVQFLNSIDHFGEISSE